ncbi:hypothetical protein SAMN04488542_102156 [Fontibacillus panacisegetis]|uniref:Uncharacterized protein n=1 Tax=Fontibacillus panacisegetis TaxID=670482 RepID=A0A1G7FUS3_9BACL|nr:hypothetical protein SAMN04488542_102156 [Fontibacillus panacisegetis]
MKAIIMLAYLHELCPQLHLMACFSRANERSVQIQS